MATQNWSPSPTDATSLAAIRWFACTLEATAIDIYATDRDAYPLVEQVLRHALSQLRDLPIRNISGDDVCPDGYVMCGIWCKPACFMDAASASSGSSKGSRAKKSAKRR